MTLDASFNCHGIFLVGDVDVGTVVGVDVVAVMDDISA